MKPHTIYVIKMVLQVPLAAIIGGLILAYFIKEFKLNNKREVLRKRKVDTLKRIVKMNGVGNENIRKNNIQKEK